MSVNFVPIGTIWDHRIITFFFQNGSNDIARNNEQQAISDAFALLSARTDLYFIEVCAANDADMVFLWGTFNHGDAGPFDGENGVLAHTLGGPPPNVFGAQGELYPPLLFQVDALSSRDRQKPFSDSHHKRSAS
jgi:hypothetical protein